MHEKARIWRNAIHCQVQIVDIIEMRIISFRDWLIPAIRLIKKKDFCSQIFPALHFKLVDQSRLHVSRYIREE